MIAWDTPIYAFLLIACLAMNWFAFRASANDAGHGRRQKLKMAAIWLTIFVVLTVVIERFAI